MSETSTQSQVASAVKKAVAAVGARLESAAGELSKIQSKGLEQANVVVETATRVTQEQIAFAEQMAAEWRKLMLAATRSATEIFTRKS